MSELYTYGMVVGAVVVVAILMYVMDRRSKDQPIDTMDAAKLGGGAAVLSGGVLYALGGAEVAEPMVSAVQDMFTGKPSF